MPSIHKVDYATCEVKTSKKNKREASSLEKTLIIGAWNNRFNNGEEDKYNNHNYANIVIVTVDNLPPFIAPARSSDKIHSEPIALANIINKMIKTLSTGEPKLPDNLQKLLKDLLKENGEVNIKKLTSGIKRFSRDPKEHEEQVQDINRQAWSAVFKFKKVFDAFNVTVNLFSERIPCINSCEANTGCQDKLQDLLTDARHNVYYAFPRGISNVQFKGEIIKTATEKLKMLTNDESIKKACQDILTLIGEERRKIKQAVKEEKENCERIATKCYTELSKKLDDLLEKEKLSTLKAPDQKLEFEQVPKLEVCSSVMDDIKMKEYCKKLHEFDIKNIKIKQHHNWDDEPSNQKEWVIIVSCLDKDAHSDVEATFKALGISEQQTGSNSNICSSAGSSLSSSSSDYSPSDDAITTQQSFGTLKPSEKESLTASLHSNSSSSSSSSSSSPSQNDSDKRIENSRKQGKQQTQNIEENNPLPAMPVSGKRAINRSKR